MDLLHTSLSIMSERLIPESVVSPEVVTVEMIKEQLRLLREQELEAHEDLKKSIVAQNALRKEWGADEEMKAIEDGDERDEYFRKKWRPRLVELNDEWRAVREEFRMAIEMIKEREEELLAQIPVQQGRYYSKMSFQNGRGETVSKRTMGFYLFQDATLAEVNKKAYGDIAMQGAHNFGLETDETKLGEVAYTITEDVGDRQELYQSQVWVDRGGHLALGRDWESIWK